MAYLPALCALLLPWIAGLQPQDPSSQAAPAQASQASEGSGVAEAAVRALKNAPARAKIGRVRGVRAKSTIAFLSGPGSSYELTSSYAFPQRSRVVLTNDSGSIGRFQLGQTLFGRDVSTGGVEAQAGSFLLTGTGLEETLLDLALRKAVLIWRGDLEFVGAGRTLSAQVEGSGILLATVNETTGLPVRIRSFDTKGLAGAEIKDIAWAKVPAGEQPRPASFTFAVGGADLWHETVAEVDLKWHFTDAWFLPADALTAVMGSRAKGKLRVAELQDAWVHMTPVSTASPGPPTLQEAMDQACEFVTGSLIGKEGPLASLKELLVDGRSLEGPLSASIVLDDEGLPRSIEYLAQINGPAANPVAGWKEMKSRTVWSQAWDPAKPAELPPLLESIRATQSPERTPKRPVRLRMDFAVHVNSVATQALPENVRLTIDTAEVSGLEGPGEGLEATTKEDR